MTGRPARTLLAHYHGLYDIPHFSTATALCGARPLLSRLIRLHDTPEFSVPLLFRFLRCFGCRVPPASWPFFRAFANDTHEFPPQGPPDSLR